MVLDPHDPAALARCERALRAGQLLGLPTETVYGLAADACNAQAVAQIFSAKGRPADHPLIVHVADLDGGLSGARFFSREIPRFAMALMQAFWPGPLTLILPRQAGVADAATGGQDSVGVRCPAHPVAQALLRALRQSAGGQVVWGLAAPSANRFGRVSPTTAAHVHSEMNAGLAPEAAQALLVLDGGPCGVGIESTIVDCTRGVPVLLRPGAVGVAALAEACGQRVWTPQEMAAGAPAPRASGTLAAHYAPQARVRLWPLADLQAALQPLARAAHEGGGRIGVYMRSRPDLDQAPDAAQWLLRAMPPDATRTAQELFAVLRAFDDARVSQIWIEAAPDSEDWAGVADRLQRASAAA